MVRVLGASVAVASDEAMALARPARFGAARRTIARSLQGAVVVPCVVLLVVLVGDRLSPAQTADVQVSRAMGVPLGLWTVVQQVVGSADRRFWVARRSGEIVTSGGEISGVFSQSGARVSVPGGVLGLRLGLGTFRQTQPFSGTRHARRPVCPAAHR